MEFEIYKMSDEPYREEYGDQPILGAYLKEVMVEDYGNMLSAPKSEILSSQHWIEFQQDGLNHRIVDAYDDGWGYMVRDLKVQRWFIVVKTIDALINLIQTAEEEILFDGKRIAIYDAPG